MESKKILLICSDGCEDIETITQIDVFTRAGLNVTVASANPKSSGDLVKCAFGTTIKSHKHLDDCLADSFDLITLPGGLKNAETLSTHPTVIKLLKEQKDNNKWYCAICASPALVFQANGLFEGEVGTCYPSLSEKLADKSKIHEKVVVSGKCITSQGPSTTLLYSLKIVEVMCGIEKAREIGGRMLFDGEL